MQVQNEKNKSYQFYPIEKEIIQFWKHSSLANKKHQFNFSVLMPPPNVTGDLHLGHALNNFLQDTLVRFAKLQKKETLWIPGFDHAGIATEIVVKKWIKKNNWNVKNTDELKKYFAKWTKQQQKNIQAQWKQLGLMIDSKYLSYTLSPIFKKIVQKSFINLYKDGLIYQAEKLINFDLKLQTVISDIEVVHKKQIKELYYVKYWRKDKKKYLVVATTRPETIFADQALLINPKDKRWQKWKKETVINPLTGKLISVLESKEVNFNFGSGVLKCTPGHDFIDFEIGKTLKLNTVVCFDKEGTLNSLAKEFAGQDRLLARIKIVEKLAKNQHLEKIEEIKHTLPYSSRTDTLVEPIVSNQWFVKMEHWSKVMLKKEKQIHFLPIKYQAQFVNWLKQCKDWCISRQLKWGHSLPIYFHSSGKIKATMKKPTGPNWKQSSDVLDTWFSSALWSLVNSGWSGDQKQKSKMLMPFDYLVTSYDIIFFWVTKMLFLHHHFTKKIPFQKILIHGLIRDQNNEKMSKSKGNVLNPSNLIKNFGVDSLRIYLLGDYKIGEDLKFDESKLIQANQFCNKLWNIDKFINLHTKQIDNFDINSCKSELNHYIYQKWSNLMKLVKNNFQKHRWSLIIKEIIEFTWKNFSNFYLKLIKTELQNETNTSAETRKTMNFIWTQIIILLHPFAPFITEFFWQKKSKNNNNNNNNNNKSILDSGLKLNPKPDKTKELKLIETFIQISNKMSDLDNKKQKEIIEIIIQTPRTKFYEQNYQKLNQFLKTEKIKIVKVEKNIVEKIILCEKLNLDINKLDEELIFLKKELERSNKVLSNKIFLKKAKTEIIKKEKTKQQKWIKKIFTLTQTKQFKNNKEKK